MTRSILVLSQYYPPEVGAAQYRLQSFTQILAAKGHDVAVLTCMPNYPLGEVFPEYQGRWFLKEVVSGVTVYRFWSPVASGRGLTRLLSYLAFAFLAFFPTVVLLLRRELLVYESPPLFLSGTAIAASTLTRTRSVMYVSDLWPDSVFALGAMKENAITGLAFNLESFAYRFSTFVTTVTHGFYDAILAKGVPEAKMLYLPNGVDTTSLSPRPASPKMSARLAVPADKKIFLYAGTHGYAHALDTLVDAASELRDRGDIFFLMVGDGSEKGRIQARARELGCENIAFHPPVKIEEMPELYSLAYACISTLRKGDLFLTVRPAKIFSTMACAKTVIYSGDGEGAEIIRDAKSGPTTPAENSVQLAAAIKALADDPERTQAYGKAGRAFVEKHYTWDKLIEAWLAELKDKSEVFS